LNGFQETTMRIALGPVLYYWPRATLNEFYDRLCQQPVDVVYLGETVCSKRRAFRTAEWIELARTVAATGRQAVLSTLTLIEAGSELGTLKRLCNNGEFLVEANDLAGVQLLCEKGVPFVTGPHVNIYNAQTLMRLRKLGLQRWVIPPELQRDSVRELMEEARAQGVLDGLETEVFGYGRLPLAFSARCFTARHYNLPKDNCQLRCLEHPEGMPLHTQEGAAFLTINGIQTQSGQVYNLLDEWQELAELGVELMRISPQLEQTEAVVNALHARIHGTQSDWQAPADACNGYWYGDPGMVRHAQG
jgi:O2-independent ubiquinone biosynthesis protein UbiV